MHSGLQTKSNARQELSVNPECLVVHDNVLGSLLDSRGIASSCMGPGVEEPTT